jgi:hypothetical protein
MRSAYPLATKNRNPVSRQSNTGETPTIAPVIPAVVDEHFRGSLELSTF